MRKLLGLLGVMLLLATPVLAQDAPEMPVPGTVVVMAGVYDGVDIIPVEQYIIVPPIACDPS